MDARQIRDMEDRELANQVATLRKDLLGMRIANATGELDDTAGLGRARRELARTLTVARERELALNSDQPGGATMQGQRQAQADG